MPELSTFLWYDTQALEAVEFYISIFPNSRIVSVAHTPPGIEGVAPGVLVVNFELDGKPFQAMNGGPTFKFNPSVSIFVHANTQEEIDFYYGRLLEGGEENACGWLTDKFGLSWQICPEMLLRNLLDTDRERASRVMQAMMTMHKLDIATLQRAYDDA
jgi:predicted 3-demethylubiquinone-9 3-methyltransferase (glyoxalase superfamily)